MKTYTTFCIAALLGAVSSAAKLEKAAQFVNWAGKWNKHYNSVSEYNMRQYFYEENSETVDELNYRFKGKGVIFADNQFSDLSKEEQKAATGLMSVDMDLLAQSQLPRFGADEGGMLQKDTAIDWFAAGKVGPVKDQGQCGSCWAFAGASTLEAMVAIRDDTTPARLSEQQAVDCDPQSSGCYGGRQDWYWEYSMSAGALPYDGYPTPYKAANQKCQNADGTGKRVYPTGYDTIYASTYSLGKVLDKLTEGPIGVTVEADNCWMFYKEGVITSDMKCGGKNLNHQVVLGKYTPKSESTPAHWTIQNSWGTGWGMKGLIKLEVSDGIGTSGVNQLMQSVTV